MTKMERKIQSLIILHILLAVYFPKILGVHRLQTNSSNSKDIRRNITTFISDRLHRPKPKLPLCNCGVKHHQDVKIVGGHLSKQHCWPWVAAIVYLTPTKGPKVICGSSVIGHRHLLTAAHCVEYMLEEDISNFRVILGTHNLNDKDAVIVPISSAISHPKYDEDDILDYDVGIITLESPLEFSNAILPICLTPQHGVPFVDDSAIVAGTLNFIASISQTFDLM